MMEHDRVAAAEDQTDTDDSTINSATPITKNRPKLVGVETKDAHHPARAKYPQRHPTVYDEIPPGSAIKDSNGLRYIMQADGSLRREVPKLKGGKKARRRIRQRGL